jgi:hypothetical protein
VYRVLVGKLEEKRRLGTLRHRQEDNIKMSLRETAWALVDLHNLTHVRDKWRSFF